MASRLALITFLAGDGGGYPDNTLPGGGPGHPDNSLPGGATTLPVYPFDPTLPDGGGGHPSTGPIVPGKKFVAKWLACQGLILVPDNSLPGGAHTPDNELPATPAPKK